MTLGLQGVKYPENPLSLGAVVLGIIFLSLACILLVRHLRGSGLSKEAINEAKANFSALSPEARTALCAISDRVVLKETDCERL